MHVRCLELKKRVRKLKSKLARARISYKRIADAASIIPEVFFESEEEYSMILSEEEYSASVVKRISNMRDKKEK